MNRIQPLKDFDTNLDSLHILQEENPGATRWLGHMRRVVPWARKSAIEAEASLRASANRSDLLAMERLAERLLEGDQLVQSSAEGERWLRSSAQAGNPFAMEKLGTRLLEGCGLHQSLAEGESWLRKAAQLGYSLAIVGLALRLLSGDKVLKDEEGGKSLLLSAAGRGSRLATLALAATFLSDASCIADSREGIRWLRRVGVNNTDEVRRLAVETYFHFASTAAVRARRHLFEVVAALLSEASRGGDIVSAIHLAFLVRRGQVSAERRPSISGVFSAGMRLGNTLAIVNRALQLAQGIGCDKDWDSARELMKIVPDPHIAVGWWRRLSCYADPEGHLVLGWLNCLGLAQDPCNMTLNYRMKMASTGGWEIADLLCQSNKPVLRIASDGIL